MNVEIMLDSHNLKGMLGKGVKCSIYKISEVSFKLSFKSVDLVLS